MFIRGPRDSREVFALDRNENRASIYVLRRAEVVSFEIWDDEWRSGFGAVNLKDVI